jgi:hypothetical protein
MSDYDDMNGVDDDAEDSFNRPVDDDFDDVEADDFDSEMKDEAPDAIKPFTTSSSAQSLAFEPTVERKDYEALDEAALRSHMEGLIADVASVIDESKEKAALLLRTRKSALTVRSVSARFHSSSRMADRRLSPLC